MPVRPIPAGSPASGTTATTTTSFCWRRPASAPRTLTRLGTRCPPQSSSLPCPRQTRACCPLARSRRGTRAPLPPPPPDVPAPRASRPLRLRVAEPRRPSTSVRTAQALITEVEVWLRVVAHKGGLAMTRKCSRALVLLLVVIVPALLLGAGSGRADDGQGGAVQLLRVIPATDCPTCAHDTIAVFDISWVDQATRRYYLADRTNNAIDVVDTKNNVYLTQLLKGQFKGFTGSNDTSGPNGVVVSGRWLFVTDAPSKVHSIDLTNPVMFANPLDIPGAKNGIRTNELAYKSRDGILLVVNNADDPPFATLVHVNTTNGHLTLGQKITFANWTGQDGHHTKATNGAEQPVWNPHTGRFYISIPEVDGPGGGRGELGALGVINPFTGTLETSFPVRRCQPAGLTDGPHNDLLIGRSETFTANNGPRWTPASPTPNPTPKPVSIKTRTGATTDAPSAATP